MVASKRSLRVANEIHRFIADLIFSGKVKDSRIHKISIHSVRITPDMQLAKVYFVCPKEEYKEVSKALKQASKYIRYQLAQVLSLRIVPQIVFYYDDSLDYSLHMSKIFRDIEKDLGENLEEKIESVSLS